MLLAVWPGLSLRDHYRPRSEASEGYVFTGVCHSVTNGGGGGGWGEVLHQMQHGTRSEHLPPPRDRVRTSPPPSGTGSLHPTPPPPTWDLVTPPCPHPPTWDLVTPPHPPPPETWSLNPPPPT